MRTRTAVMAVLLLLTPIALHGQRRIPRDLSGTRGFNYRATGARTSPEFWEQYKPAETERDLDYALPLKLNQVRVFLSWDAWTEDKPAFRRNLLHFVRAAHARGIGVMATVQYAAAMPGDSSSWPQAREWAQELVATIGKEPGLQFWDVMNEPECCELPASAENRLRMRFAVHMANVFRQLDKRTPVTIGATFADNMIAMGDSVDVLSYHNYYPTRAGIRAEIAKAKAYAARTGKPLLNTEIGCTGRANPYDVALQEHMNAHVGWYIWELMVTRRWGTVHGVFYPNGTVRDPSIVAALFGMFRNRGSDNVLEDPDREGWVTRTVDNNRKWLVDPKATWEQGLELAETSVNLLEANQLVAMHELPSREIQQLRNGPRDMPKLRADLENYTHLLEPYRKPAARGAQ